MRATNWCDQWGRFFSKWAIIWNPYSLKLGLTTYLLWFQSLLCFFVCHNMLKRYQGKCTFPRYSSAIEHEALTAQTQVSPHRKTSSFWRPPHLANRQPPNHLALRYYFKPKYNQLLYHEKSTPEQFFQRPSSEDVNNVKHSHTPRRPPNNSITSNPYKGVYKRWNDAYQTGPNRRYTSENSRVATPVSQKLLPLGYHRTPWFATSRIATPHCNSQNLLEWMFQKN